MAKTTTSLARTADTVPATATVRARMAAGDAQVAAMRAEHQS
jgi:hypothetical protein